MFKYVLLFKILQIKPRNIGFTLIALRTSISGLGCDIRGKCFPRVRKNYESHTLNISIDSVRSIYKSSCWWKAYEGECSHILGLLYTICHYKKYPTQNNTVNCVQDLSTSSLTLTTAVKKPA